MKIVMYRKYTGIILKKHPLGEADELLTIFTKETGKLRVKARSVRKIKSRLAGHLQSLNEIEFETATRSSAAGGGRLPVLISVRAKSLNNYLRENLKKFAYALIGAETLYRLAPDRQENPGAYAIFLAFLRELGQAAEENFCLRRFQVRLLQIMGFGVDFQGLNLAPEKFGELAALVEGREMRTLSMETDRTIEHVLNYVLEREIKSANFLRSI